MREIKSMKTVLPGFWYLDNFNLKKRFCDKKHEILTTKIYNFKNSAGPIYRAIITSAPHMPKQYYRDRGRSANPRYYLVADRNSFKNNYLPLEISLYLNNYGIEFLDTIQLKDILKDEPVIKYFTVINR